jgi:hypothetical protein
MIVSTIHSSQTRSVNAMVKARIAITLLGILLPYVARLPRGLSWVAQYLDTGLGGFLLIGGFNAVAWGAMVALGSLYRRPVSLLVPSLFGFAFLAWAHYSLDLRADAQSAIALVFIPIYALLPIAIGGAMGYAMDRFLRRRTDS